MADFPKRKGLDPEVWTSTKASYINAEIASRAAPDDILVDTGEKVDGKHLSTIPAAVDSPTVGTLHTTLGTEQVFFSTVLTKYSKVGGYIDLTNMNGTHGLVLREYMKIKSGGTYVRYAENLFDEGPYSDPLLNIETKPSYYGLKITGELTSGSNIDFDYLFNAIREK